MADPTEAEGSEQSSGGEESPVISTLRKQAKTAEERVAQLERELAFNKAGLEHLSDKQATALFRVHEGDITADSLKATAEELGFGHKVEAGESTPASPPDHNDEVTELAALSNSPNAAEVSSGGRLTQEQIDQKTQELISTGGPEALIEWRLANGHLFGDTPG